MLHETPTQMESWSNKCEYKQVYATSTKSIKEYLSPMRSLLSPMNDHLIFTVGGKESTETNWAMHNGALASASVS